MDPVPPAAPGAVNDEAVPDRSPGTAGASWVSNIEAYFPAVTGITTGAMAVTPSLAAEEATDCTLLLKKPLNQGIFVPVRTKVATVSPGAMVKTWPTICTLPASET